MIGQALKDSVSHSLSSIDLSKIDIGSEGAKVLAPAICDSHSLTECNLRQNKLGKEGWCAIFDALGDSPQNTIAKWDLSCEWQYGGLDSAIVKSLTDYMAVSRSLTQVQLDTALDPAACSAPRFTLALTCAYVRSTG